MTAEVAVMNTSAVALATDSAASIGEVPKVYSSVNKLFALSATHPVGIMIYNRADFMGVPWESIIKIYRQRLSESNFPKLQEYFDSFLMFLRESNDLFPTEQQQFILIGQSTNISP